jgi:EAL domain-containing protein (putative c-di-GMP-specific phosphodiesterase class I)
VVAEGVECKEQLDYLKQHKCDVIQGYYFSKPLNPEQWIDIWALENLQMTKSKTMVNPSQKEPLN